MNIKTLKVFSDLVANTSFSKTARQNHVSQSAISQKIKLIESKLNVNLLDKNQKNFQLTREGTIFYKYAQQILSSYQSMLDDLQNNKAKILGDINILTSHWIGIYIIPPFIHEYFKMFKRFNVDISYTDYSNINAKILDTKLDLGIFELPISGVELVSEPFMQDEFVVIGLTQTFPKKNPFPLEKLENSPLIGFNKIHPLRALFERAIISKINHPHYIMEFNQIELIKQAIETHNGIAVLPRNSINLAKEGQIFQILPFQNQKIPLVLYVTYRKNCALNASTQQFLSVLMGKNIPVI
jgi:DNA-binding transcriptional LysR family regulator